MSSLDASLDLEDFGSTEFCSCASSFLNPPSLVPLQSVGCVTIGGVYGVSPGLPTEVNTSLFVVCCGDVHYSHPLLLSPINVCVMLGASSRMSGTFLLSHLFRDPGSAILVPNPFFMPHNVESFQDAGTIQLYNNNMLYQYKGSATRHL